MVLYSFYNTSEEISPSYLLYRLNITPNANTQEKLLCAGNLLSYTRDMANFIFIFSANTD